jgi:hypothetical protein
MFVIARQVKDRVGNNTQHWQYVSGDGMWMTMTLHHNQILTSKPDIDPLWMQEGWQVIDLGASIKQLTDS